MSGESWSTCRTCESCGAAADPAISELNDEAICAACAKSENEAIDAMEGAR